RDCRGAKAASTRRRRKPSPRRSHNRVRDRGRAPDPSCRRVAKDARACGANAGARAFVPPRPAGYGTFIVPPHCQVPACGRMSGGGGGGGGFLVLVGGWNARWTRAGGADTCFAAFWYNPCWGGGGGGGAGRGLFFPKKGAPPPGRGGGPFLRPPRGAPASPDQA